MSDTRDPAIKLFGKTIPLPEPGEAPDLCPDPTPEAVSDEKDVCGDTKDAKIEDPMSNIPEELDSNELASSSSLNIGNEEDTQTCTQDAKAMADPKTEHDRAGTDSTSQEKILKKPDKILPCPRCKSMDTKFCYYNNYNVNQPRHFCKNCQRYWTAGGTMRNVPVGAGRRKSKNLASHHRHLMMISDGLPHTCPDVPDSAHHQALSGGLTTPMIPLNGNGNGAVLNFCPEAPLRESMASVRNVDEQKRNAEMGSCGENKEDPTCASSVRASTHIENDPKISVHKEQNEAQGGHNGIGPMHKLPCYPGPPFVFPWNPGWSNAAAIAAGRCSSDLFNGLGNGGPNPFPWSSPPMLAAPAFCSPPIAVPLVPSSFWSYMSSWPNGTWNVPWLGSNVHLSPPLSTNSSECSGNSSPTLGKHSRDAAALGGDGKTEKSLWVPKTLRIDDPDEAAKSSIWATLGIKPGEFIKKDGIFKAFQSKTESKVIETDAAQILHANPAALCRSQTFQEST